jgi:predicted metal-binding membrane protein
MRAPATPGGDTGGPFGGRVAIALAVAAVTALAWLYLWRAAASMDRAMMGMADKVMAQSWSRETIATTFAMWTVMMVGMMLPGAAPTLALFATLDRRRRAAGGVGAEVAAFGAGYLAVWTGFSAAATLAQWALDQAFLLTMAQATAGARLSGVLVAAAGLYQFTPLKHACLRQCRSPIGFLLTHWRSGRVGAFLMGARHGAWCVTCCAALMLLLFVGGVMNLAWAAALAVLTMAEKLVPKGELLAQLVGVVLVIAGAWLFFHGYWA